MKKDKVRRRLPLNRETVRQLNEKPLRDVAGGSTGTAECQWTNKPPPEEC